MASDSVSVLLRLDPALLKRVDKARGSTPRSEFIRAALAQALPAPVKVAEAPGVVVGYRKPRPGARLKGAAK